MTEKEHCFKIEIRGLAKSRQLVSVKNTIPDRTTRITNTVTVLHGIETSIGF